MPNYVPRQAIRFVVGNLHVETTDDVVVLDIRSRLISNNPKITEAQIKTCVKYALKIHHENRQLYRDIVTGRI